MKFKAPAFLMALALTAPMALAAYADSPALPSAATADQVTTSKLVYGLLSDSRYAYRPLHLQDVAVRPRRVLTHRQDHATGPCLDDLPFSVVA